MVSELTFHECGRIKPFFSGPGFDLLLSAIHDGNSTAQIWTDVTPDPESVFLWDQANNVFYLSGCAHNQPFNDAVATILKRKVIPDLRRTHRTSFRLRTTSTTWTHQATRIFQNADLREGRYTMYAHRGHPTPHWTTAIPEDFELQPIDDPFLNQTPYANVEAVTREIRQMWPSIPRFLQYGFGYALVHDGQVASWCTSEYLSQSQCGLGIETVKAYRNRGLATLVAAACVEHSQQRRLQPHWECNVKNHASRRVAEKVGFTLIGTYPILYGRFS
jgi:RimJ/RimL family protein N-acetyltransferase